MTVLIASIVVVLIAGVVGALYLVRRMERVRRRLDAVKAERQRKIREDGLPAETGYVAAQIDRELDALQAEDPVDRRKADRLGELRALLERLDRNRPVPFDAAASCMEEVDAWRGMHPTRDIRLERTGESGPVVVLGDDAMFRWVLREMFSNVLDHAGDWSAVTVRLDAAGRSLALAFEDDGDGPDLMMVSRFYGAFTPRVESPGPGLGLFVARAIVERMGGAIQASPGDRGGLVHSLRLPVAASERAIAGGA